MADEDTPSAFAGGINVPKLDRPPQPPGAVHGRRAFSRNQILVWFAKQPPCLIGVEACATAHYGARELTALGDTVRQQWPLPTDDEAAALATSLNQRACEGEPT
jgi:transposase